MAVTEMMDQKGQGPGRGAFPENEWQKQCSSGQLLEIIPVKGTQQELWPVEWGMGSLSWQLYR
jgi:hypothetical protein